MNYEFEFEPRVYVTKYIYELKTMDQGVLKNKIDVFKKKVMLI